MKTLQHIITSVLCFVLLFSAVSNISAQAKASTATQGNYKSIYEMLKDVPGLEVQSNNGRGGTITVRGISSLKAQGQPLFVVDGSIYGGDIANLNTQDIDNIVVLKDAASTTAYGTQGAFGVISITTKKGSMGAHSAVAAETHTESAYTYFIDHKTPLKVFNMNEEVIIEGVIQKQKGDSLVFIKKRRDFMVPISSIKRVEMVKE
jgi:TonB-dependent SusC/RagA subfamily outer membrane receptor